MADTAADLLQIRAYEPGDEDEVLDLLTTSLAGGPTGRRTPAFFRWKHAHNPFGTSFGLVAVADGRIVGCRLFLRWRFAVGDHLVPAVRAVDTATHPDARGRGVFKRLTLAAVDAVRPSVPLVFNTPNAQSRPGYLSMGWQPVGVVPIAVRVARPLRVARRGLGALRAEPAGGALPSTLPTAADVLADGPGVAALLAEAGRAPDRLTTDRSLEYLRWRYGDAPDLGYRAFAVERDGRLAGLGIGRLRRRGALHELTLAEVLVRHGDEPTARALLRDAARSGCDHVAAHLAPGTALVRAGRRRGYVRAPGGMGLVANALGALPVDPHTLASWQLSLGDLEVF